MYLEVMLGVIHIMQQHTIITLKNEGDSNREVARKLKISKKTVARYWNEYKEQITLLGMGGDIRGIQEAITKGPAYDTSNRKPLKYTPEIGALLDEILAAEAVKRAELGPNNKQMLTCKEIHKMIVEQGHRLRLPAYQNIPQTSTVSFALTITSTRCPTTWWARR